MDLHYQEGSGIQHVVVLMYARTALGMVASFSMMLRQSSVSSAEAEEPPAPGIDSAPAGFESGAMLRVDRTIVVSVFLNKPWSLWLRLKKSAYSKKLL